MTFSTSQEKKKKKRKEKNYSNGDYFQEMKNVYLELFPLDQVCPLIFHRFAFSYRVIRIIYLRI